MAQARLRILVTESDGFSVEAREVLRHVGELRLADLDRLALLGAVGETEVLWVRLRHRIDAEVMAAAPRLRMIVTATTGTNHIDLQESKRRNIKLVSLRGESDFLMDVRATAEHTIGLILALLRHIPAAASLVESGGWDRNRFRGCELYGKTAGIIGYGRLGRIVARYLNAFGMAVLVADPHLDAHQAETGVTLLSLAETLRRSHLITMHASLSDETRGFFGHEQFAAMMRGAWFVNTARGELLDEDALLGALQSGYLGGAALDVVTDEHSDRIGGGSLVAYAREHSNLIITPHIGGCTKESMHKTELFLAQKLAAALRAGTAV